jgi:acid phosphatase family membrane protein YuiD
MTTQLSPYLLAVVVGWVTAQGLKYLLVALRTKSFDHYRQLYLSGNMPSAHSATTVSLATVIGLVRGVESVEFAIAALFAGVVMYDALMVRRSVGEQGTAIQMLIKETKSHTPVPRSAKGHTPMEVLAGAMLGVVVGFVVFIATK